MDPEKSQSLDALERFILENEDLRTLEERIGRFNIFDALGVARAEIRHSNFLAWLLDPAESHGCGELFLNAVLIDLLRETSRARRPLSPLDLDGEQLQGVEIRREWRHIDLLIRCASPRFVIAIENKIDSAEHSNQLERYRQIVDESFPREQCLFVFLTPDGEEASDEEWVSYSYRRLHAALLRARRTNEGSIGEDVLAFLDHYLRLLESRMMDDPKIVELCKRIYKNHRQAIDLIVQHAGSEQPGYQETLELLESDPKWRVVHTTNRAIIFVPQSSIGKLVARRSDASHAVSPHWLTWSVRWGPKRCSHLTQIGPSDRPELRRAVVDWIIAHGDDFGLRISRKNPTEVWTRVYSNTLQTYREEDSVEPEAIVRAAQGGLRHWNDIDAMYDRLATEVPGLAAQ